MTPFAVASLIAGAIGEQSDLGEIFTQLGWLVTATVVGLVTQFTVVYCGLYTGFIRSNPFKYYAQMIPAYATAFGGASSAGDSSIASMHQEDWPGSGWGGELRHFHWGDSQLGW